MPLFEGDPLVLRCQAWQDWPLTQVTFYRDGSALGPSGPSRELSIAALRKADSGRYHCSALFRGPGPGSLETASPVAVTVQGESEGPPGRDRDRTAAPEVAGARWRQGQGAAFASHSAAQSPRGSRTRPCRPVTYDPCVPVSAGWTMVTLACRYILSSPIHVKQRAEEV